MPLPLNMIVGKKKFAEFFSHQFLDPGQEPVTVNPEEVEL